jgi:DNA-binding transcriptional ArsR family regulator
MATDTKPEDPSDEAHVTDEHVLVSVLGDHPKTKILATFIGNPEMDFNVTEIAEYSNLKRDTVYKYLDTLKGWGLIEETRRVGNSQMYALNTENDANEAFAKFEWELLTHLGDKEQAGELDDQNNPLP